MARAQHTYSIRLQVDGAGQVKAVLTDVGASGEKSLKNIHVATERTDKSLSLLSRTVMTRVLPAFTAGFSALSLRQITLYSDKFKQMEGRLKIVSGSMGQVADVQERLFAVAQDTRQPLEDVTNLYTRLNLALGENRRRQFDVIGISQTIAKALAVTGEGTAQAQSAILQFSQAVQSDFKGSAQEINALLDSAPRLALALQQSFGDGTRSLKDLAKDGALSTQSVLRALEPLSAQARAISEEFRKLDLTVGQALTQLDNAFLKLIGQSALVDTGTSSLAAGLSLLAQNLDHVAEVGGVLAAIFGSHVVSSLLATSAALTANAIEVTAYQLALARMAGITPVAAAATTALAGSLRLVSGAMALVGGPLGVAMIGTMVMMQNAVNGAHEAQSTLNGQMSKFRDVSLQYQNASDDLRVKIEEDTAARIESYKHELTQLESLASRLGSENFIFKKAREWGSVFGIDTSAQDVQDVAGNVREALQELEAAQSRFEDTRNHRGGTVNTGGGTGRKIEAGSGRKTSPAQDILDDLKKESAELEKQISLFGEKDSAIQRALKTMEIENRLREDGVVLTDQQRGQMDATLIQIEKQQDAYEALNAQQERLAEQEKNRRAALDQLGVSFASAFEDAIVQGQKFSDVLNGLLQDIQRILLRRTIIEPLASSIGDAVSGSGFFKNLFPFASGGVMGSAGPIPLRAYAAGGVANSPQLALYGEGRMPEAYVPLPDGRSIPVTITAPPKDGGGVNVTVINNAPVEVGVKQSPDSHGAPHIQILIDEAVAQNIGTPGSKTRRALTAFSGQGIVRR